MINELAPVVGEYYAYILLYNIDIYTLNMSITHE